MVPWGLVNHLQGLLGSNTTLKKFHSESIAKSRVTKCNVVDNSRTKFLQCNGAREYTENISTVKFTVVGTADSVLIREVSFIQHVLNREVSLYQYSAP